MTDEPDYTDADHKRDQDLADKAYDLMEDGMPGGECPVGASYALFIRLIYTLVWRGWTLGDLTRDLVHHVDLAEADAEERDDEEQPEMGSHHEPGHA